MRGVFLAYRRSDTAGHVGRLHDHLAERFGADRVFMDVGDIAAGEDFTRALDRELAKADVVLVAIGPGWLGAVQDGKQRLDDPTDHHRREIESAILGGKRLVPVLFEGARMPAEADLPPSLRPLARCQAVELRDSRWNDDVMALAEAIARPAHRSSDAVRPGAGTRRDLRLGLVMLAAVLAAVILYNAFLRPEASSPARGLPAGPAPVTAPAAIPGAPTPVPLVGLWRRANGSRWSIVASGSAFEIEEIHHDSGQPWLRGRGELDGGVLHVSLAHLYGGDLRLGGTLALSADGRTLSGRLRRDPGALEETVVLARE